MTFRTVDTAANARALVPVSSSRDFLSTSTALSGSLRKALALVAPAVAAGALLLSADAIAQVAPNTLPSGSTVQAGSVTITQPDANKLQITQGTDKAIIDWRSYSIGSQGWVNYTMPGQSSVSLNRVTGGDLSYIMGKLTANGTVMLVNPNGIIFGRGSVVDVGGLVATTANIRNDDFMAGRMNFTQAGNPGASVINEGSITIKDAGVAAFVAPGVANRGIIEANLGTVSLAAGNTFTLDLYGDGLVKVAVTDPVTVAALGEGKALVENSGTIKADGGKVLLSAAAAKGVVDQVINMDGAIQARRVSQTADGTIVLDGGDNGTVNVAGKIDVSATGTGVDAGKVTVTGEKVHLRATAHIDATAKTGNGGTVKVGGDYKGQGTTRQAKIVVIDAGALINVSATDAGNGGTAIVWSTDTTNFNGMILAKGGALSGNGGLVETSGADLYVGDGASVITLAANGQTGMWLLDPTTINVAAAGADGLSCVTTTCNISVSTLETGLAGSNVTLASTTINFNNDVSYTGSNSLTLDLGLAGTRGNLNIAQNVTVTLSNLILTSPRTGNNVGVRISYTGTNATDGYLNVTNLSLYTDVELDNVASSAWRGTQPTTVNIYKHPNNPTGLDTPTSSEPQGGKIQDGIDFVASGGTVNVGSGEFFETLSIGKSLSLLGANAGKTADDPTRGAETVIHTKNPAFVVNETVVSIGSGVSNVVIKGFTIDGFDGDPSILFSSPNPADTSNRAAVGISNAGTLGSGIEISNNIFKNLELRAIDLTGPSSAAAAATGLVISGNVIKEMGTGVFGFTVSLGDAIRLQKNIFGTVSNNTIDGSVLNGIVVSNYNYNAGDQTLAFSGNKITASLTSTSGYTFDKIDTTSPFSITGDTINGGLISTGVVVKNSNYIDLTITNTTFKGGLYGVRVLDTNDLLVTSDSHGKLTIVGGSFASSIDLATILSLVDTPTVEDIGNLVSLAAGEGLSVMLNGVKVGKGMNDVTVNGSSFSTIVGDAVYVTGLAASNFTAINGNYTLVGGNAINFENQNVASTVLIDNNFIGIVLQNGIRLANLNEGANVTVTNNTILGVGQNGILLSGFSNTAAMHIVNVNGNDVGGVLAGDAIRLENFSGTLANSVVVKDNIVGLVLAGNGITLYNFHAPSNGTSVVGNTVLGVVVGDGIRLEQFAGYTKLNVDNNFVTLTAGNGIHLTNFQGDHDVSASGNKVVAVGGDGIRFQGFTSLNGGLNDVSASGNIVIGALNTGSGIVFDGFSGDNAVSAVLNLVSLVSGDGIRFANFSGTSNVTAMLNGVVSVDGTGILFTGFDGTSTATAKLNAVIAAGSDGIRFNDFDGTNVATAKLNLVIDAGGDGIGFSNFHGSNTATALLNGVFNVAGDGISFDQFCGYNHATAALNLVKGAGDDGIQFSRFTGYNKATAALNAVLDSGDDGISFVGFAGRNKATALANLVTNSGGDGIEFAWFAGKTDALASLNIVKGAAGDGIAFNGFFSGHHGYNHATAAGNIVDDVGGDGITFNWFTGKNVATATLNLVSDTGNDGIAFNNFFGANLATAALNKVTDAGDDGIQFKNFFGASAATATLNKVDGADDTGIVFKNFFGLSAITAALNVVSGADTGIGVYNVAGASLITVSLNKIDLDWFGTGIDVDNVHGFTTAFITWNKIEGDKGSIGIRVDDVHGLSFFDIAHNNIHLASSAWGYGWFESIGIKITDVEDFAHFSVSKNKIDIDGSGGTGIYIKNIDDWSTFKIAWNTIYVDDRGTGIGIYKVDDRTSFSVIGNRIDLDKYGVGIDIDNVWDKADFFIAWNHIEGDKGSVGIKINDVRDWAEFDIYRNRIELESSVYGHHKESIGIKITNVDDHAFFSIKKNTIDIDGSGGTGIYVREVDSAWYKPTGFKIEWNTIYVDDHGTGISIHDVSDKSWFKIAGNRIDLDKYGTGISIGDVWDKADFFIGWNKIEGDKHSIGIKIEDASDHASFDIVKNRIELESFSYGILIKDVDDRTTFSIVGNKIDIDGWFGTGIKIWEADGKASFFISKNKIFVDDFSTGVKIYDVSDKTSFWLDQNFIWAGDFSRGVSISKVYDIASFLFTSNFIGVGNKSIGVDVERHGSSGQSQLTFVDNFFKVGYWSTALFVNNLYGRGGYNIDFQYDNTIKGPTDKYFGITFLGEGLNLAGDTFGNTKFVGQAKYYIYLAKGALYEPGEPTLIDVSNVNFNGLILGPTPSAGNIAIIEARAEHFLDNGFSGLLFPLNYVQPTVAPIVIPNFNLPQWDPNRVFEVKWFEPFKTSFKWLSGGPYNFGTFELDFPLGTFDPNNVSSLGDIAPAAGPGSDEAKQAESCSQNFMGKFWVWYQQCGPGAQ